VAPHRLNVLTILRFSFSFFLKGLRFRFRNLQSSLSG
jgi:hypothetical protein